MHQATLDSRRSRRSRPRMSAREDDDDDDATTRFSFGFVSVCAL